MPKREGYTFLSWYKGDSPYDFDSIVTEDFTLIAKWERNKYVVTWNIDGKLYKETYEYGIVPTYNGVPLKESDNTYTYSFEGWDKSIIPVTEDITYTATYSKKYIEYVITFKDYDGTILGTGMYHYGDIVQVPTNPTRTSTAQYTYTFTGWDREVSFVDGDRTYTATYTSEINKYNIIFKNYDGTILQSESLEYGSLPVYNGKIPIKISTAEYSFVFNGWNKEIVEVTGDTIYVAIFNPIINKYAVTWNIDGVLYEETYEFGQTPTYDGNTSKNSDSIYNYSFIGWDKEINSVTGDVTYTAQYDKIFIEYNVVFEDWDGTILSKQTYHYGDEVMVPNDPSRIGTTKYTYIFNGWNKDIEPVTTNVVYKAIYNESVNKYNIIFKNYDGIVLQSEMLEYGTLPIFKQNNPTKNATAQYTYTFTGWDNAIGVVTSDIIYTAVYSSTVNKYTVTWNVDGTLYEETYEYGQIPEYAGNTTKGSDNTYTYKFTGWDKEINEVTADVTYIAQYERTYIDYLVVFKNYDGTILSSKTYHYGDSVVVPANPTRVATAQYTYTFTGWDSEVSSVTGSITYTATYTFVVNKYTVTWDVDGITSEETYEYGQIPEYIGNTSKTSDNTYAYKFIGWDKEINKVTGNVTYTAQYEKTYIDYLVVFKDYDDTILSSTTYHYGDKVQVPANPTRAATAQYTYTFAGWDSEVSSVTGSKTYIATYSSTVNKYTVTWDVVGITSEEIYEYGQIPEYTGNTSKASDNTYTYKFIGWDKEINKVTGNVTYTAQYEKTYIEYLVVFEDWDGTILSSRTYHYGDKVILPKTPIKEATAEYTYNFIDWNNNVSLVTDDATYIAIYEAIKNKYTVTFIDENEVLYYKEVVEYGNKVTRPVDPEKTNHIFLGWYLNNEEYDFEQAITGNVTLNLKWLKLINVDIDSLVNDAYITIDNQTKKGNSLSVFKTDKTISINIIDTTLNSVVALSGTGIATAAENLLNSEGVESVTISIPGTEISVTVTKANLMDKLEELDNLFEQLATSTNGTASDLIGKSINITINLSYGYMTSDYTTFKIDFIREISVDELANEAYTTIKNGNSKDKFNVYKNNNAIKITILDKTMNSVVALSGTGIATVAKDLLSSEGVSAIRIFIPGTEDISVTLTANDFMDKLEELDNLFVQLAGSTNATAGDLIGKSIDVEVILKNGYVSKDFKNLMISFAEPYIYQVHFNTNGGNNISPQLVYDGNSVIKPSIPTKEGSTFKYWSLNGEEFDFNTPISGDIELLAIWELNKYNVIFKDIDGTIINSETYYYGDQVIASKNPKRDSTNIYTYTFKNWDKSLGIVTNDIVYTAIYNIEVNVDYLIDDAYNVINNNSSKDKFTAIKDGNVIDVSISDLSMNSVTALSGTGIATVAENLLTTDGIKSVLLAIPGTDISVTVTENDLMEQLEALDELFTLLSGEEESALGLVGKAIRITINLDDNYTTKDNSTFVLMFTSMVDVDKLINDSYNVLEQNTLDRNVLLELNSKNIITTILNTNIEMMQFIAQSALSNLIDKLLLTTGIDAVVIKAGDETLELTTSNLIEKINALETIFIKLVYPRTNLSGNLAGKTISISLKLKDGFIANDEAAFTISYDAIYTVSYNVDGKVTTTKVKYNDKLVQPDVPTKEGYTFSHWELNGTKYDFETFVDADIELVAVWNINKYEVTFTTNNNLYGEFDKATVIVDYGTVITIEGNLIKIGNQTILAIPTDKNSQYTYKFVGLNSLPLNNVIKENIILEGNFIREINSYIVTWNVDGMLYEETYEYGQIPEYTRSTTKDADNTYTYKFTGWDKEINEVTGNVTYTAQYEKTYIDYLVEFKDYDGSVLSSKIYHYCDSVVVPSNPIRAATAQYTYTFTGWDSEVSSVTGNVTYTATYSSVINKYTVTWNVDGQEVKEIYEYGQIPEHTGNTTKDADNTYTYKFTGWDKEINEVTADVIYTAQYEITYIDYLVVFKNWDGTILSSKTYHYGDSVVVPSNPTRAATTQYTYTFVGWDSEVSSVIDSVTYTATYSSSVNKYRVIFKNYDGTELQSEILEYGSLPSYKGVVPTRNATAQYTYMFSGWNNSIIPVTQNIVYIAQYSSEINKYRVVFKNHDGTILQAENLEYGSVPVYSGEIPNKESTLEYSYAFEGWDKQISAVTSDIEYIAQYSSTINEYTIIFKNYDGTVLQTEKLEYGTLPTYKGNTPTRSATAQYTYTFTGWNKPIVEVTGNTSYTATYTLAVNKYTVTWNVDGTLYEETYEYGQIPEYTGSTTKDEDNTYTYKFIGWDKDINEVTGNVTYTAQYEKTYIDYLVEFKDYDGSVLSSKIYHYGDSVVVPSNPIRAATAQYTYTFTGWDSEVSSVTDSITYTAIYTFVVNKYTVTWNVDGHEVKEIYEYGQMPEYTGNTLKAADNTYTYSFTGWNKEINEVTADVTYIAQYEKTYIDYLVVFKNYDGTILSSKTYHYGDSVVVPSNPIRAATAQYTYTFVGWDSEVSSVTDSITYTATYTFVVNKYTVTWDVDGIMSEETYEYGQIPEYTENTSKASDNTYTYKFIGWDKEINKVTGNVTYTAQYEKTYIEYLVVFEDWDGTILSSRTYHYGDDVVVPSNPTRAKTAQYTYTFAGWDSEVSSITGSATYTATYSLAVNKYKVVFKNYDGTVLQTSEIAYGTMPTYNATPEKPSTNTYKYVFTGWDKTLVEVVGDATYIATYKEEFIDYIVEFKNWDGTVLSSKTYHYDDSVVVPSNPTRSKTAQYTYTFSGWDKEITNVTGNKTYTATYSSSVNKYTVAFKNYDGTVLQTEVLEYGVMPTYKGETPTRPSNAETEYAFAGWDKEVNVVTGNITYTALLKELYVITFKNYDGTILSTNKYFYGDTVIEPEKPTKPSDGTYNYVFVGWDSEVTTVSAHKTYIAQYKYLMNVDEEVEIALSKDNSDKFDAVKSGDTVTVSFKPYKNSWGSQKNPPYSFSTISGDVLDLLHNLSSNELYESVVLSYTYTGKKTQSIDLKKYDLTDRSLGSWFGSGSNDAIGNWLGYLCTGSAGTLNAYSSNTSALSGKTVTVTVKLKEGYASTNGSDVLTYYITFV